jgi:hypothetical protein
MPRVREILQFRLSLEEVRPTVWRRIQVPADCTLVRLHRIIQAVMGWQDYHLHEFTIAALSYGDIETDEENRVRDERAFRLRDFHFVPGDRIEYEYDLGDSWRHVLQLEEVIAPVADGIHPLCIGGENSAPPEDVGGASGYEEFLEALFDPSHEEHEDVKSWVGRPFHPTVFSVEEANERLRKKLRLGPRRAH